MRAGHRGHIVQPAPGNIALQLHRESGGIPQQKPPAERRFISAEHVKALPGGAADIPGKSQQAE